MRRRHFLTLPAAAFAAPKPAPIAAVEIWKLEGRHEVTGGIDKQFQANMLHVYDELRPAEYRDGDARPGNAPLTAYYLRIRTQTGLEGLYGPVDREAAAVINVQLAGFLKGKDALAGETLWDQMLRSNRHSRRGHYMMAISAVDNALWDLRGRHFNTPVYRLLGGPTRARVEAYGSCLGYSLEPEKLQARAKRLRDAGFRHQKWFMAWGPGDGLVGLEKNVRTVRLLREAVGDETEIMFDAFMGWDLNYAISWAKQVERYRPRWIEEAFPPDRIGSFAELRKATSVPVASGEHIYNRWETHDYLKAGALNVIQTDPEWCGGVSESVKICSLASLYDVPVIPHGHGLHAAMHVVAGQSPATCPLVENLILKMSYYHHFEKSGPRVERGFLALPDGPGFGIELDDAKIEKRSLYSNA